MCLVALAWKVHPRWRLLLAGNRDEFHGRPTAPLAHWVASPDLMAGQDLQSGGTWAGVDAGGRMAVVTNVRDPAIQVPGAPSRGQLAAGFLQSPDSADHRATGLLVAAEVFAPFNLLLADAEDCEYLSNYPTPRRLSLAPGVHGLSNGDLDEPWPKTMALKQRLAGWLTSDDEDVSPLWQALADETQAPDDRLPDTGVGIDLERMLSPAFIRGDRYGTRASTLIAIDHAGHGWISERRFGPEGVFEGETTLRIGAWA
ncbi:NRDE family protein [Pseudoxanthomonas sp. PXM01]|uniref:NRDE family protein n=1 Tax=Pseudoxanthomonas sp. PXM01 TaxID=2769295 RepID=UPI001783019F|nr:NRDE family protein [Pseudoxanthomonas sp. PXM01]MBD9469986.1 NRDE family protein [Pseudoxanthomonas sp. PXM01]